MNILKVLITFMAALCFSQWAAATTATASYTVNGTVVNTCTLTATNFEFGSVTIPTGQHATTSATWTLECTSPVTVTLYPAAIGDYWPYNNGLGLNIAQGAGTVYFSMTVDGVPFQSSGIPVYNSGSKQFLTVVGTLTPVGAYSGLVSKVLPGTFSY